MIKSIIYILVLCIIIAGLQFVTTLPWWIFTIPLVLIGIWHSHKGINRIPFLSGFIAGFIVWAGATLFFHNSYAGNSIVTLGSLIGFSPFVTVLLIGAVGGILAGLSVFSGALLFKKDSNYRLDIGAEHKL